MIVDLTEKYIYASYNGVLSGKELQERPSVTDKRRLICNKEVWKKLRPEKGDYFDHITNGSFYDSGYGYVKKAIQNIGSNSPDENFTAILKNCKISFAQWDMEIFKKLIFEWDKAVYHMSKNLLESIKHPAYIRLLNETS